MIWNLFGANTERRIKKTGEFKFSPETKRGLNPSELAKLFFLSFQFSQGDISLQLLYMTFISRYYGNQKETDLEKAKEVFIKKTINRSEDPTQGDLNLKVTKKNAHIEVNPRFIEQEVTDTEKLYDVFTKSFLGTDYKYTNDYVDGDKTKTSTIYKSEIEQEFNLPKVTQSILYWDIEFAIIRKGRPNRLEENTGSDNLKDKYFSFFVNYIIRSKNTGDKALDDLLSQVKSFLPTFLRDKDNKSSLIVLVDFYNETHPKTKVTKEELGRVGIKLDI